MHTSFWLRSSVSLFVLLALLACDRVAAAISIVPPSSSMQSAKIEVAHRSPSPVASELIEDCLDYPASLSDEEILAIVSRLTEAPHSAATGNVPLGPLESTVRMGLADSNDNFASSTTITLPAGDTAPQAFTGDNSSATKEAGEPNHGGDAGGHSLWWKWTPAGHARVSLYSVNSDIPTVLAVYTGSTVNNLTVVPHDAYTARVSEGYFFNAVQGVPYYFAIDGVAGATGKVELSIGTFGATPPNIVTQPVGLALSAGMEAYLRVEATGSGPLLYQWYQNGVASPFGTSSSFVIANGKAADAGTYYVVVSNSWGTATSNSVAVTFPSTPAQGPVITEQPGPQNVTLGGGTQFSVKATGEGTITYQWHLNGAPIAGATNATLIISKAKSSDLGTYTVVVTDAKGSVTSNSVELRLLENANPPQITEQPKSQTVTVGSNVTFQVTATSDVPLFYLWAKNSKVLGTETSSTLTLNNVQTSDAGNYSVNVSNAHGTVASATVTLTVNQPTPTTPPTSSSSGSSGGGGGGAPSMWSLLLVSTLALGRRLLSRSWLKSAN